MLTIRQTLTKAYNMLKSVSISSILDAEILLAHVLKISRAQLLSRLEEKIDALQAAEFQQLITRRQQGEPIAYLMGQREFWSLSLQVTPATLIPRPETELLVECVLTLFADKKNIVLADLGTGAGAIALALAKEQPSWKIIATDISAAALDVARVNQQRLATPNVIFLQSDWCEQLPLQKFHAIVSNPPYIAASDPHLKQGDLRFEPSLALVAEEQGLAAFKKIIAQAKNYLLPAGYLLLEHGYDQAPAVTALLQAADYHQIQTQCDYAGLMRVTYARTQGLGNAED